MRRTSAARLLNSRSRRATLMPPPVLPADAPTTIRMHRMARESCGHRLKSSVAKPVVVITLLTVKDA